MTCLIIFRTAQEIWHIKQMLLNILCIKLQFPMDVCIYTKTHRILHWLLTTEDLHRSQCPD